MRIKSLFLPILLAYVVFLVLIKETVANMGFTPLNYLPYYFMYCFIGYFLTVIIEYLIGYGFVGNSPFFSKAIILTNLISYPIAQFILGVFYFIIYPQYLIYIIILVEFIVILMEWFLLYHFYKTCNKDGSNCFGRLNTRFRILYYCILANLVSYLIGSILFIFIFPETSIFFWIFFSAYFY